MNKKLKVYCDIDKYLQTHYEDLYALMDALCVLGAIKSNKFRREKTFIIPTDAEIKKLMEAAVSEDDNKINEAIKKLKASSIEHYLPDGKSWSDMGVLRNGLGQELKVDKASDKKITIGKCEIEKVDVHFLPIKTREGQDIYNYALYKVVSGSIPTDTPQYIRGEATKTGSRARYVGSAESDRMKLVADFAAGTEREKTINLNALFICAVRANIPHLYLLPCLYTTGSKTMTYGLYVLTKGANGEYLIPEEVLAQAQNPNNIATPKEIYRAIDEIINKHKNFGCFRDVSDHIKTLNGIRRDLNDSDKNKLVEEIKAEYKKLLDGGFYPPECVAFFGGVNHLIYIHYLIFLGNFAGGLNRDEVLQKLSKLYTCSDWESEDCLNSTVFGKIHDDLYTREKLKMLAAFVSSDAFLYQHAMNAEQLAKITQASDIPIKYNDVVSEDGIVMSGAYDE